MIFVILGRLQCKVICGGGGCIFIYSLLISFVNEKNSFVFMVCEHEYMGMLENGGESDGLHFCGLLTNGGWRMEYQACVGQFAITITPSALSWMIFCTTRSIQLKGGNE